jgi:hypothetical protein
MDSPYAYAAPVQASLGAPLLAPPLVPAAVATMPAPTKKVQARPGTGPKKPKRPKTAYHFFFDAERKAALDAAPDRDKVDNNMLSRQLGTISASRRVEAPSRRRRDSSPGMMEAVSDRVETAIRAGQRWKAMDANARRRWDELAKGAKEDYDEAVRLFEAQGGRMHDVTPTKPLSAYMLYFRAKHQAQKPDEKVTDFAKVTGAEWKALSDQDKQPFHESAKKQRDLYDNQVAFCAKSCDQLIGEKFLDGRPSVMAFARVALFDQGTAAENADEARAAYHVVYDDQSRGQETLSLGELKARVCGDERAAKRAAARVDAAQKKRKAMPPPPMYQVPVDKKPKVTKKPPPPPEDEPEPFTDNEILNVLRLTRRVAAGANVSNLKKLCAAAGLANVGSKAQLASRLERFLREKNFEAHPFIPSHADNLLPFAEFDAKYQAMTVLEIAAVEKVVAGLL